MEVPKNDPLQPKMRHLQREAHQVINHALITRSWFIHQTLLQVLDDLSLKKIGPIQECITTKLRVLPEDEIANLSSLQTLRIEFCNHVESLFGGIELPTLKSIFLPLDIEHFSVLETLLVDKCDVLEFSKEHNRSSNLRLKIVNFISLPQLVTLPHWLQGSVDTLQYLLISSCNNLSENTVSQVVLICTLLNDIHHLTTLERLEIDGYPEFFQHLTIDEPEEVEEERMEQNIQIQIAHLQPGYPVRGQRQPCDHPRHMKVSKNDPLQPKMRLLTERSSSGR
ncbi:hypothetical protein HKD37_03G007834 [Glycine soja]